MFLFQFFINEENPKNLTRSFCISKPECYLSKSGVYHFEESEDDKFSRNCSMHLSYALDGGYKSHSWYILAQSKDRLRPRSPYSSHSPCIGQNFTSPFDVGQLVLDDLNNDIVVWKGRGYESYQNFTKSSTEEVEKMDSIPHEISSFMEEFDPIMEELEMSYLKGDLDIMEDVIHKRGDMYFGTIGRRLPQQKCGSILTQAEKDNLAECLDGLQDDSLKEFELKRSIYLDAIKEKIIADIFVCFIFGLPIFYLITLFPTRRIQESRGLSYTLRCLQTLLLFMSAISMIKYAYVWEDAQLLNFLTCWKHWAGLLAIFFYVSSFKCADCLDNFVVLIWRGAMDCLMVDVIAYILIQFLPSIYLFKWLHYTISFFMALFNVSKAFSSAILCKKHNHRDKLNLQKTLRVEPFLSKNQKPAKSRSGDQGNSKKHAAKAKELKRSEEKSRKKSKNVIEEKSGKTCNKTVFIKSSSYDLSTMLTHLDTAQNEPISRELQMTTKTRENSSRKSSESPSLVDSDYDNFINVTKSKNTPKEAKQKSKLKGKCAQQSPQPITTPIITKPNLMTTVSEKSFAAFEKLTPPPSPPTVSKRDTVITLGHYIQANSGATITFSPGPKQEKSWSNEKLDNQKTKKCGNLQSEHHWRKHSAKGIVLAGKSSSSVDKTVGLNHWISSQDPIGTPPTPKSKFLPFMKTCEGSPYETNGPMIDEDDVIDFKFDELKEEDMCSLEEEGMSSTDKLMNNIYLTPLLVNTSSSLASTPTSLLTPAGSYKSTSRASTPASVLTPGSAKSSTLTPFTYKSAPLPSTSGPSSSQSLLMSPSSSLSSSSSGSSKSQLSLWERWSDPAARKKNGQAAKQEKLGQSMKAAAPTIHLANILRKEIPKFSVENIANSLDEILATKSTSNLTLNEFRELVEKHLSEEDIFISDEENELEDDSGQPEDCPICTEPMITEVKSLDVCGHKFHEPCISAWLNKQKSCPTCRSVC